MKDLLLAVKHANSEHALFLENERKRKLLKKERKKKEHAEDFNSELRRNPKVLCLNAVKIFL